METKVKIVTEYTPTSLPDRSFDWTACREDWDLGDPIGFGATEQEAIDDLLYKEESWT